MAIKFKSSVETAGVQREIWTAIGYVFGLLTVAGYDTVVTSLTDGQHNPGSLHAKGLAVDLRSRHIPDGERDKLFNEIQATLHPCGYDCVNEGPHATAATTASHWHVEFDPKNAQQHIFEVAS